MNSNNRPKKARKKHLIAGPAGVWFQRHQEQSKQYPELSHSKKIVQSNTSNSLEIHNDLHEKKHNNLKNTPSNLIDSDSRLLRSDAAQTWDCMCLSLLRIVVPRHQHIHLLHQPLSSKQFNAELFSYHIVRKCVSEEFTLLFEVLHPSLLRPSYAMLRSEHVQRWSSLPKELSGLVIPQIILQIDHVYCHGHCDWTVELIDESIMDCRNHDKNMRGSLVGWVEESFVKRNPSWIRPGVVLYCKNVSLAVFPSSEDDDRPCSVDENKDQGQDSFYQDSKVDRMILLGEESIIYAWTPEEAAEEVSNQKFLQLMEMRAAMFSNLLDDHSSIDNLAMITRSRDHARNHEQDTRSWFQTNVERTTGSITNAQSNNNSTLNRNHETFTVTSPSSLSNHIHIHLQTTQTHNANMTSSLSPTTLAAAQTRTFPQTTPLPSFHDNKSPPTSFLDSRANTLLRSSQSRSSFTDSTRVSIDIPILPHLMTSCLELCQEDIHPQVSTPKISFDESLSSICERGSMDRECSRLDSDLLVCPLNILSTDPSLGMTKDDIELFDRFMDEDVEAPQSSLELKTMNAIHCDFLSLQLEGFDD